MQIFQFMLMGTVGHCSRAGQAGQLHGNRIGVSHSQESIARGFGV